MAPECESGKDYIKRMKSKGSTQEEKAIIFAAVQLKGKDVVTFEIASGNGIFTCGHLRNTHKMSCICMILKIHILPPHYGVLNWLG